MKTKEELSALKEELENMNKKLAELSEDELNEVASGANSCDILMDEDMAEEAAMLAKAQVYQQTHQAMLAQAKSKAVDVLGLLQ